MSDATVTDIDRPTDVSAAPSIPINETPGGVQFSVDPSAPTEAQLAAPTTAQKSWLDMVPEEYRSEGWVSELAKNENPNEAFFKAYKNQLKLVGQKGEGLKVPGDDAKPEDWEQFHKAIGRPEKADDYAYEPPKPPEGLEEYFAADEKLQGTMKEAAHKAGLTQRQFKTMSDAFDAYYSTELQSAHESAGQQLKQAEETFKKHYGEKSPQVLGNYEKAASSAPDWAKPILGALQPATKAAIASLLFNFSTKYVSEDRLDVRDLAGAEAMNEQQYGDAYEKAFAAYHATSKKPQSPEHLKAKADLLALQSRAANIFKKG